MAVVTAKFEGEEDEDEDDEEDDGEPSPFHLHLQKGKNIGCTTANGFSLRNVRFKDS